MEFKTIDLSHMPLREDCLKKVKRYIHEVTDVMFYRSDLFMHGNRVKGHLESMYEKILGVYPNFDIELARTLALVHDDAEIINGDVKLYDKEKMTREELKVLEHNESLSIPKIVEMFGKTVNGYDYEKLLRLAKEKNTIEAQFVSFCDKLDGGGEAWHEVFAGNYYFIRPAKEYIRRLNAFSEKHPATKVFFEKFPQFLPKPLDFLFTVLNRRPHTKESLTQDTGYSVYEFWKQSVIKSEGINKLIEQVEFLNQ